MKQIRERALTTYRRYEKFVPAVSFIAGMLFDILTLGRIDQLSSLLQQAAYLTIIMALLCVEVRELRGPIEIKNAKAQKIWHYREEAFHFLLGSLLSSFTLFYFKSSSFIGSFAFFVIICACLVGNEFSVVRSAGLAMRTVLFCICLTSYLFCLVPILWHSIGLWQFLTALVVSLAFFAPIYAFMVTKLGDRGVILRRVGYPYAGVIAAFLVLYLFKLIPPVPLSLTHIGIYRSVERVPGGYKISYTKPFWRFWEQGDQFFRFRKGERIYCFFSVFSPGGFKDSVKVRWLHKDERRGWQPSDAVPVAIAGGRNEGWRGFAYKANYQPGDWQVRIETKDEREIGRIYLYVEPDDDESAERIIQEKVI